eukprot:5225692-Prymnesium_polylepis.3
MQICCFGESGRISDRGLHRQCAPRRVALTSAMESTMAGLDSERPSCSLLRARANTSSDDTPMFVREGLPQPTVPRSLSVRLSRAPPQNQHGRPCPIWSSVWCFGSSVCWSGELRQTLN